MCSKAEEKSKVVCKVCGSELELTKKNHYVATDNLKTGAMVALAAAEEQWYDAFDCPVCGCQYIVGERKRAVKSRLKHDGLSEPNVISDEWEKEKEDTWPAEEDVVIKSKEVICEESGTFIPSCYGKELKDADKDCIWCEQLNSCLGVPECFGSKDPFKIVTNECRKCSATVRRKCLEVYKESLVPNEL